MLAKTLIRNLTSPPTKPTLPCSSQLGGTINSSSDLCAQYTYSFKVLCIYARVEKMSTIYQLISLCWTSQVIGVRSFTRFFFLNRDFYPQLKGSRNLSPFSGVGSTLNLGGQIVNRKLENSNYRIFYTIGFAKNWVGPTRQLPTPLLF